MSAGGRGLTPSEKYFAFLDPLSSMNLLIVAHLDLALPPDFVADRWARFVSQRVTTRLRIHEDLTIADGGASVVDFRARELPSARWDDELAREMSRPFGLDRPMGCRYLHSPDEGRSRLYLTVHHAAADGRGGVADLQAFLRSLDGQPVPEQRDLPRPGPPPTTMPPWQQDARARVALIRAIRDRQDAAGPLTPVGLQSPGVPGTEVEDADAQLQVRSLVHDSGALVAGVKRQRSKMFAALAGAWLIAVAEAACAAPEPVLQLVTPVDLAARTPGSSDLVAASVGVLSARYRVTPADPWSLARCVQERIAAATRDGEGELFFRLARIDTADRLEAGTRLVQRALAEAPPAVSVTNLGVIDPGSDPPWVQGMCGFLAPSANHVAFVSGAGYRGRLVQSFATSPRRMTADSSTGIVDAYQRTVSSMAVLEVGAQH